MSDPATQSRSEGVDATEITTGHEAPAADGRQARCYTGLVRHAAAWLLLVAGLLIAVGGLVG